jgi:hypothetical protein
LKLAPRCPSARSNPARCRAAAGLVYFIFDLLHLDGDDVGALPLIERKARLAALLSGVVPPLGFRAQDRKLVIVDSEAELIRSIFRRYAELAIDIRVHRVTAMGQLAASIAHEVNQAIAATVTNAQAALRWLDRRPADLEEAAGNDQVPAVCRRLFQHLEDRSQQAWADLLLPRSLDDLLLKRARDNWSEYSLYHLLAEHNKVLFDYHFLPSSEDSTRLHCQPSVWTKAQFAGWDPKYCFDRDTAGLFLVVQSSSTIFFELICRQLNPYLPIKQPMMASLTHRLRSLWEDIRTVDGSGSSRKSRRIVPTYRRYHRPSSRLSAFRDIRMASEPSRRPR